MRFWAVITGTLAPLSRLTMIAAASLPFFVMGASPQVPEYQIINFIEQSGIIKNPGIGYQTFERSAASDRQFPSAVLYARVNWSQIQPAPRTYDFSPIDRWLSKAELAGQRLAFRIMGFEAGNRGPIGLKNAGYPGYTFTFDGRSEVWFPDMDQSVVQGDLTQLIASLGERYGNNPLIDSMDIGLVGDWGEFHFWNTRPTAPMPSTRTLNILHDKFAENIKVPLVTSGTLYDKDVSAFRYALQKHIGWRVDCWGDYGTSGWNHMRDLYPHLVGAVPDAWKFAPVLLETCDTMTSWVASNYPWRDALQWAVDNHASAFNNQSAKIPPVMYSAVQEMIAKLGYRFVLTEARLPTAVAPDTSFNLTLDWT